jgi:hypothetical protein
MLLSGSKVGFTFAGEGPVPERSDLETGYRELGDNTMLYVLGLKTSVLPTSIWHSQMCQ